MLVPHGYIAVDFFFVLSGFIMSYTYASEFAGHGWAAVPGFLEKRIARIAPLNTFIVLLLAAATGSTSFNLFANLFMLQGIGVGKNLNDPSWSISVEFFAYLMFPVLLFLCLRTYGALALLAASLAGLISLIVRNPHHGVDSVPLGAIWNVVRCVTEFSLGLIAHRLFVDPRAKLLWSSSCVLVAALVALTAVVSRSADIVAVLLFPFLVAGFGANRGWPSRALSHPFLVFLGRISYSIYLVHDIVRNFEYHILGRFLLFSANSYLLVSLSVLGAMSTIPVAWATYTLIEKPSRNLVRSIIGKRPQAFLNSPP
jgi:peptidoglycan/LPS O-acetylase OafA/YrhL